MAIAATRRCEYCDYDLRGIVSAECPERGRTRSVVLRISEGKQFEMARAALEHARILLSAVNPKGLIDYLNLSASTSGFLRIEQGHLEQAEAILSSLGVHWTHDQLLVVNPESSACPRCSAPLHEGQPETCPQCRAPLYWQISAIGIDVDDEVVCPNCIQQVYLSAGKCPDCGTVIAKDAERPGPWP